MFRRSTHGSRTASWYVPTPVDAGVAASLKNNYDNDQYQAIAAMSNATAYWKAIDLSVASTTLSIGTDGGGSGGDGLNPPKSMSPHR